MAVQPEMLGPSFLSITQSVGLFQGFLPRFSEIRQTTPGTNPTLERDIHAGMIGATMLSVGMGAVIANLTGSPVPVFVAMACCIGLISLYEWVYRVPGESVSIAD